MAEEEDIQAASSEADTADPEPEPFDFGSDIEASDSVDVDDAGTAEDVSVEDTASKDFNPDSVEDWLTADPNTLPEQYRPLQNMAKNMQSGVTKVVGELRDQQKTSSAREQELMGALKSLAEKSGSPTAPDDPYAHLDDEGRETVRAVQQIVEAEAGGKITDQGTRIDQLTAAVKGLVQHAQHNEIRSLNSDAVALRGTYGNDIDRYGTVIQADLKTLNPQTNKPYTMEESYLMRSGKLVDKTIKARQDDLKAREDASLDTTIDSAVDATEGKTLTEHELLSRVGKLPGLRPAGR